MNLKTKSVLIIISLLMISSFGFGINAKEEIISLNDPYYNEGSDQNNHDNILETGSGEISVDTFGPIAPMINIAEIHFIDGSFFKIILINWIIENNFFTIRPNITIDICNMTFLIDYTLNVKNRPLLQRYAYETIVKEDGSEMVYDEKHTLIVSDFSGTFEFARRKPLKLSPAFFSFYGTCENVIVSI